jgi:hypothetical protein
MFEKLLPEKAETRILGCLEANLVVTGMVYGPSVLHFRPILAY